jgi:Tfp pilus assembly protein PilN
MVKIDFVPNDYIQQRRSSRANFMYLILFVAFMGVVGVTFSIIKIRQRAVESALVAVNTRMAEAQGQITQLEELQINGKTMMRTMAMTAELLDPVPKSVILACLTNNMPGGVSLLELKLTVKEAKPSASKSASASQYQAASAAGGTAVSKEKILETHIEIKGIAPSDIEVANYIAQLGDSILLTNVALVESKEHKIDTTKFREFKLTAVLKKDVRLTKEDIESIRAKSSKMI